MDLMTAMDISATGMAAERIRLNVISMNLANAQTTKTEEGIPYQRRTVIFRTTPLSRLFPVRSYFAQVLQDYLDSEVDGVKVERIEKMGGDFRQVYDPAHPDADENGYVLYPNINLVEEMVNMLEASRSYEANVTAVKAAKSMALKAMEIGR
ncbi:MAG: flagellar basal body rod protein FlgC [Deltaproteobacteria bacterium]|nr:flagellar basal body rod protein FlgC [Deltaproteobacteria bacterium]MBW2069736.1 flagellar basal body rod protein FlgC [Deltaproteobacteria bacterium]